MRVAWAAVLRGPCFSAGGGARTCEYACPCHPIYRDALRFADNYRTMRLILSLILLTAVSLHAQELDRTLKTIDFEERRLGNPEELPMHWTKVEGVGMPHDVNGLLSTER